MSWRTLLHALQTQEGLQVCIYNFANGKKAEIVTPTGGSQKISIATINKLSNDNHLVLLRKEGIKLYYTYDKGTRN